MSSWAILAMALALAASPGADVEPVIETGDVDRFFEVYDEAGGHPAADVLQREYLDRGSVGLQQLARMRNVTGQSIAAAIAARPEIYAEARDCLGVLPRVRNRLVVALRKLRDLYPGMRLAPITIAIGRGKPVGVGGRDTGVQIGAEALCATDWMNPDIEDRFVRVIMHEYAHVQQAVAFSENDGATVLAASLEEGAAEFLTELTTGAISYAYLDGLVAGREREIETAFAADAHKTDLSDWLYNSTPQKPADLGYWVGYRIVQSYYHHADDKHAAIRDILEMTDPEEFRARSGWQPGVALP
jgi:hypothetical protein